MNESWIPATEIDVYMFYFRWLRTTLPVSAISGTLLVIMYRDYESQQKQQQQPQQPPASTPLLPPNIRRVVGAFLLL